MKKLLSLLAACSFAVVGSSSVVACTQKPAEDKNIEGFNEVESKIIRDIVSENKVDYKFIDKELTYNQFFNKNDNNPNYIMDALYTEYKNKLNETEMTSDEQEASSKKFFQWLQTDVKLVYLNKDKEIKVTYKGDEEGLADKKLEDIYLDAHEEFNPDDKEFHDTLALRIGNLDNLTFTFGEEAISWDLNRYNIKPTDQLNKIWISVEDYNEAIKDANSFDEYLKKMFWFGMFDADDRDGNHDRQLERFDNQKLSEKLIFDEESLQEFKQLIANEIKELNNDSQEVIREFEDLGLELTKDVFSKTTDPINSEEVKDYILKKSQATIEKIEIHLI